MLVSVSILGGASVLAFSRPQPMPVQDKLPTEAAASAKTYEDLATAIIGIEKAEDELVRTILIGYHAAAQHHLQAAISGNKKSACEAAAAEISNIANEGNAAIRAVRQRLAQAGHTHNTDVETKEDYMFVTNKEKKELLALAQEIAKLGDGGSEAAIKAAGDKLHATVAKALADE